MLAAYRVPLVCSLTGISGVCQVAGVRSIWGKTKASAHAGRRPLHITRSDRNPTENEQAVLSLASDFMEYLELTRYPQRLTLEQLLIDEQ